MRNREKINKIWPGKGKKRETSREKINQRITGEMTKEHHQRGERKLEKNLGIHTRGEIGRRKEK